ncbi:MAG: 1-deoxy-D-xylulose-5-phosphate reductoisomerase [Turicibacter sp.]|nr:1-deoxy-D-xylulose-5-phosphate reductoisomerase [Turicibacter sp.]
MKNIYLLGATGSIGTQTLDVIRTHAAEFCLRSFSSGYNITLTRKIIQEFKPAYVSVARETDAMQLRQEFPGIAFGFGENGLEEAATYPGDGVHKDLLITAVMGSVGLLPTLKAIGMKRDIAIANKETLVTAGHLVMEKAKQAGVAILPVDSEHSAIYQCLQGEDPSAVKKLIITASGGSFRDLGRRQLEGVSVEQALSHPNWSMGSKITVDSATMMNKGLEVIEAHWLFGLPYEKIETVLHKQSVIHSMVEFHDTSVMAQLGTPDMRIPIQLAMGWPDRLPMNSASILDLAKIGTLDFKEMDFDRYPALKLAYLAGAEGGTLPTVLNAANEEAVNLFLNRTIPFLSIEDIVENALGQHKTIKNPTLEEILAVDEETRRQVNMRYKK